MIRYDIPFSEKILDYSLHSLKAYIIHSAQTDTGDILDQWPYIAEYHSKCRPESHAINQIIHGDYNRSNIHIGIRDRDDVKVVDWEWAGVGMPHYDLASLLKRAHPSVEMEALRLFARGYQELSLAEHERWLRWCLLERKLLDAAFLAKQQMESPRPGVGLHPRIRRSVADVLAIAKGGRSTAMGG